LAGELYYSNSGFYEPLSLKAAAPGNGAGGTVLKQALRVALFLGIRSPRNRTTILTFQRRPDEKIGHVRGLFPSE
jgi:hypothetical protein